MSTADDTLLQTTPLLDYRHPDIAALVAARGWAQRPMFERVGAVYDFVRNEIAFGYNESDDLSASRVLADGYGQCNTKATLLMALLRSVGIPCRLHGFTIDKRLQKGAVTGIAYRLAPASILHSWVEIRFEGRWVNLEGFILDTPYLAALQARFAQQRGAFCGYGVATPDLQQPPVTWEGSDTYIQKAGINHDFGVFADPDTFYARHGTNLAGAKRWLFRNLIRHRMNRAVAEIRASAPSAKGAR